jgi:transposase
MSKSSDEPFRLVEVTASVQRRCWSVAEKVRLVEEAMQLGMRVFSVARHVGIFPLSYLRLEAPHA